jgi:hypothetical protein
MIFEAKGKIKIKGSDLEVEAQNKVNFKAVDVELEAQSQGKLKATNIEVAAQASTKITGNASASLEASGQVTIKGAMVNIN